MIVTWILWRQLIVLVLFWSSLGSLFCSFDWGVLFCIFVALWSFVEIWELKQTKETASGPRLSVLTLYRRTQITAVLVILGLLKHVLGMCNVWVFPVINVVFPSLEPMILSSPWCLPSALQFLCHLNELRFSVSGHHSASRGCFRSLSPPCHAREEEVCQAAAENQMVKHRGHLCLSLLRRGEGFLTVSLWNARQREQRWRQV